MAKKPTQQNTALTKYEERARAEAKQIADSEAFTEGGSTIHTRGGMLKIGEEPVPGNSMQVVVLDSVHLNTYYAGQYNPDAPEAPVCYAFCRTNESPEEMVPHEKSEDPQNETCSGCKHNEWGSAERGRGKACSNVRRLALISAGDLDEDVNKATVLYIKVPVTSVQFWRAYVKELQAKTGMPPYAVVTTLSLTPHDKHQFHMEFAYEEMVPTDQLGAIMAKRESIAEDIVRPFPTNEELETSRETSKPKPVAGKKGTKSKF